MYSVLRPVVHLTGLGLPSFLLNILKLFNSKYETVAWCDHLVGLFYNTGCKIIGMNYSLCFSDCYLYCGISNLGLGVL